MQKQKIDKIIQKLPSLSVFFPAYNEEGNIEAVLKQALSVLPRVARKFEVIVIDDGSTDATLHFARKTAERYNAKNGESSGYADPLIRVIHQENKGYGGAVKRGLAEARFEWVFFSDADRQFDLSELKNFIEPTQTNDLVIGYRKNRAEGWKRRMLAVALKIWNKIFLGFPLAIRDIDCAFKLIHRRVLDEVLPLLSDGAMVSTELLFKAHRLGFAYRQIGVNHYERVEGSSTGSNPLVIAQAVIDTFSLRKKLTIEPTVVRLTNAFVHDIHDPWLGLRVFARWFRLQMS